MLMLQRGGALVLRQGSADRALGVAGRWRAPCSCGGGPRLALAPATVATMTTMTAAATGADSSLAAAMRAALDQGGTDGLAATLRTPPPDLAESMAGLSAEAWVATFDQSSTLGVNSRGAKEKGRQVGTLASMMNTLLSTLSDDRADGTLLSGRAAGPLAIELLDAMSETGCMPDVVGWCTVACACFEGGDEALGVEVLERAAKDSGRATLGAKRQAGGGADGAKAAARKVRRKGGSGGGAAPALSILFEDEHILVVSWGERAGRGWTRLRVSVRAKSGSGGQSQGQDEG